MKGTIKKSSIICLFLFVFALILKYYLYFGLLFCTAAFLVGGKMFRLSWKGLLITLFSALYFAIYVENFGFSQVVLLKCLLICASFIAARQLADRCDKEQLAMTIVWAFMFHSVVLLLFGIRTGTVPLGGIRAYHDVFMGMALNATGIEAYYIPIIGAMYYLVIYRPKIRLLSIAVLLVVLASCVLIGGRGIILISALVLCLCCYMDFKYLIENQQRAKMMFRVLLILSGIITVSVIVFSFDIMGIRSFLESSTLVSRFTYMQKNADSVFASVERMDQNRMILNNLGELWLTGGRKTGYDFVHNAVLSMVNSTGIFPALCYVLFLIATLRTAFLQCMRLKTKESVLYFGLLASASMYLMMEPVFESTPWLLAIISLLSGLQTEEMKRNRD